MRVPCGSKTLVLILVIVLYQTCYSGSTDETLQEANKPNSSFKNLDRWDPNTASQFLVIDPIPQGPETPTRLRTEEMMDPKTVKGLIESSKEDRRDITPFFQGPESSINPVRLESRGLTEKLRDDEEIVEEYKAYVIALMKREKEKMEERRQVVRWTNRISCFIFVIVHGFIGFGFWAALREFRYASKTRAMSSDKQEIQVSLQGIALKTSLHGTILLAISLVLYFLYLKFVYPIE